MFDEQSVAYGSDPEVFLVKSVREIPIDADVVGSERLLGEEPIRLPYGQIVRDGVQVELHPTQTSAYRYSILKSIMDYLSLAASAKGYAVSKLSVVEVPGEELFSLGEESRRLGCQPSLNIYTGREEIDVSPDYPIRSAGGHIHMDLTDTPIYNPRAFVDHRRGLVPLLDIVVGNTIVPWDQDSNQRLRRELYGKAGEYRLPHYGVEYRTPSNAWIWSEEKAVAIHWLVARTIEIWSAVVSGRHGADGLLTLDTNAVREAINTNDVEKAAPIWGVVKRFLEFHRYDIPEVLA